MENETQKLDELREKLNQLESKLEQDDEAKLETRKEEENPLFDIYTWKSAVYFNKDKNWFTLISILSVLSVILALLFENFMLVFVIIAVGFYIYVLNTIKPISLRNSITNKGVRIDDELYLWNDIHYFWVSEKDGEILINLELNDFKGRRTILVGKGNLNKILFELTKHEDYRHPTGLAAVLARLNTGRYRKFTEIETLPVSRKI